MKGLNGRKRKRNNNPTFLATQISNNETLQEECIEKNRESKQQVGGKTDVSLCSPTTTVDQRKVFFIIEEAHIHKIQVKKGVWKVAQSLDHAELIHKKIKDVKDFRSDIVHEVLKGIFDSRLCKLGMVGGVYVKIANGVLFEIKPHVRITRTLQRFCGVMFELLNKSCVRAKETNEKLLQVIEEPVTRHLPPNSQIIGISGHSKKVVDMENYVSAVDDDRNLVFVIGASPHGTISEQYADDLISVSNYELMPRQRIDIICKALENQWNLF